MKWQIQIALTQKIIFCSFFEEKKLCSYDAIMKGECEDINDENGGTYWFITYKEFLAIKIFLPPVLNFSPSARHVLSEGQKPLLVRPCSGPLSTVDMVYNKVSMFTPEDIIQSINIQLNDGKVKLNHSHVFLLRVNYPLNCFTLNLTGFPTVKEKGIKTMTFSFKLATNLSYVQINPHAKLEKNSFWTRSCKGCCSQDIFCQGKNHSFDYCHSCLSSLSRFSCLFCLACIFLVSLKSTVSISNQINNG